MCRSPLSTISPRVGRAAVLLSWAMAFFALAAASRADVATRNVDYRVGGKTLKSVVFHDNEIPGKRPGVLLAHEKGSESAAARIQATRIARLGYIVMSVDLYGDAFEPKSEKEAFEQAALDAADRSTVRTRLATALTALTRQPHVDPKQIAGVGYGIGGAALVELARTGVDLEGVVLLHGRPLPALPKDSAQIQPTMLLIAGESDPSVPAESIKAFQEEMKRAKVECMVVRLPGVAHDFTDEAAGKDIKSGAAYDAAADRTAFEKVTAYLADEVPPHWAARIAAAPSTPAGKAAGTGQATASGSGAREPGRARVSRRRNQRRPGRTASPRKSRPC